ncbi:MAG: MmgE/PrpD family protein, partial [Burkholderiaceae bacterium]|nr:MmgE/PrpD family protein [Burkholderiaceae bacterium]
MNAPSPAAAASGASGAAAAAASGAAPAASPAASAELARFAAQLRFEDIPEPVVRRAEDLLVDWFGSALAGKGARPVETIARFFESMGPADGPSEVLIHRRP